VTRPPHKLHQPPNGAYIHVDLEINKDTPVIPITNGFVRAVRSQRHSCGMLRVHHVNTLESPEESHRHAECEQTVALPTCIRAMIRPMSELPSVRGELFEAYHVLLSTR